MCVCVCVTPSQYGGGVGIREPQLTPATSNYWIAISAMHMSRQFKGP